MWKVGPKDFLHTYSSFKLWSYSFDLDSVDGIERDNGILFQQTTDNMLLFQP